MTIPNEMVERGARAIAPLAWAALGTGDTLAQANRRKASLRHARAALEAALSGHVVGWREITEDNEPPRDVELLLGWWRTWPERKWEYASGLYGSTKGGWVHGNATHWQTLPAPPVPEMSPTNPTAGAS